MRNGGWNDYDCQGKRPFICKVKGKESGGPVIPDTSTAPPSVNCGYGSGWVEDPVIVVLNNKIIIIDLKNKKDIVKLHYFKIRYHTSNYIILK